MYLAQTDRQTDRQQAQVRLDDLWRRTAGHQCISHRQTDSRLRYGWTICGDGQQDISVSRTDSQTDRQIAGSGTAGRSVETDKRTSAYPAQTDRQTDRQQAQVRLDDLWRRTEGHQRTSHRQTDSRLRYGWTICGDGQQDISVPHTDRQPDRQQAQVRLDNLWRRTAGHQCTSHRQTDRQTDSRLRYGWTICGGGQQDISVPRTDRQTDRQQAQVRLDNLWRRTAGHQCTSHRQTDRQTAGSGTAGQSVEADSRTSVYPAQTDRQQAQVWYPCGVAQYTCLVSVWCGSVHLSGIRVVRLSTPVWYPCGAAQYTCLVSVWCGSAHLSGIRVVRLSTPVWYPCGAAQ